MRTFVLALILSFFVGCNYVKKNFTDFEKQNIQTVKSLTERVDNLNELAGRSSEVLSMNDSDEIMLYISDVWDAKISLEAEFKETMESAKKDQEKSQWRSLRKKLLNVAEELDDINLGLLLEAYDDQEVGESL